MMTLVAPNGQSLQQYVAEKSDHRKERPLAIGPAFGDWAGRDAVWNQMPGGAILNFNLDALTLADYRAMRYNPQINSSLSVLTFMLHQVDWHIECEDQRIADTIEGIMRPAWTRLVRGLSQAFWAGFSPMAIEYDNDVPNRLVIVDKFKDLVPEDCKVHWKEVEGGYAPPGKMKPKFKIYDGIDQHGFPFPIPAENTLWYPLLMENGDYYGRKLLKAAFAPWYFSTLMHLFANRYYERFGEPVPIGRAPFDEDFPIAGGDGTETVTGKQAMEMIVQNLRNRGTVVLPSDREPVGQGRTAEHTYTIEYLESQMRGVDFERYMSRLDEEMSLALFTPLLLLRNADVGSHNLGVQHTQTWLWMLNALTGDMKEYIDRYVVERLKAMNFTPNAPRVEWKPHKMGRDSQNTLRGVITALINRGAVMPDLDELGQALGMTLNEVVEVTRDEPGDMDDRVRERPNTERPRGVGEPRATGREISNRVRGQVEKAFRENRFGVDARFSMGYRKRFIQALMSEGIPGDAAESATNQFYDRMEKWVDDATSLGQSEYSGPRDFMAMFDRLLDSEIDRILA